MQEKARIDPKGRVLIPQGIRRILGLESGADVVLGVEGRRMVLTPITDASVTEITICMNDQAGSLARVAEFLSREGFDLIMSESRSLERSKSAEWRVFGGYKGDLSALAGKLKRLDCVDNVKINNET
jgi:bifunctional DNA-binding transcriptional regulator/antitoxin component of YhaV-PrlF toxin-antitoxin module